MGAVFKSRYVKGVPFRNKRYIKRGTFSVKVVYKMVMVGPRGGTSPYSTLGGSEPATS